MKTVTIKKRPRDVIIVTEDHGGYLAGHCYACGASGWIDGLGYPHHAKNVPGSHLQHKESCPMNELITKTGNLKRS